MARRSMIAASLAAAFALAAQSPPAFDLVSLKHSGNTSISTQVAPGQFLASTRWWKFEPGRVSCNLPLSALIQEAYSVRDYQISAPPWVDVETYDFAAMMPAGTPRATVRLMLRAMLADRFQLKLRKEQKEFPVFDLVEAKGGFKLKPVETPESYAFDVGVDHFESQAITLSALAEWLQPHARHPVLNKTGLAGAYHIRLDWTPSETHTDDGGVVAALGSIGLKLEPRKALLDYLIVEHAEKEPTAN